MPKDLGTGDGNDKIRERSFWWGAIVQIRTSNTILYCQRWTETVVFYRDVLKLDVHFASDWFVEFSLNDWARLSIANEENASIKSCNGKGITVCFQVDDIQSIHNYLMESGVSPTPTKVLWGSTVFYFYDPEGNRIEIWSESLDMEKSQL